ncbi:TPA: homocysteine S-methyltransferase family protein [Candidatus Woesearchaeota archaeon]|nr:homocysteine S-methyltransferase family protein [Candidatus Woesearchaeota archaeon]HII64390.1 homocysteine S-methyltransferase family protein [Candidatus Woesearchaeota archaeon]HIJ18832.1 homocysteine S-methyltransferase family protein [Candidatus Woesearchaeota archaeon]
MVKIFTPAYGTALEAMGVPNNHEMSSAAVFREAGWRALLQELTDDYVRMGQRDGKCIDGIMTHTFRCSPHFVNSHVYDFNRLAADVALSARERYGNREMKVFGVVGPMGRDCYDPSQASDSVKSIMEYHHPQVEALKKAGVDGLWPETINTVREGKALVALAKDYSLPVYLSFVLDKEGLGNVRNGTSFSEAIKEIDSMTGAYAKGYLANCSTAGNIKTMLELVPRDGLGHRIGGFYPNASNTDPGILDGCDGVHQDVPVKDLIGFVKKAQQNHPGIRWDGAWVSGCCGYGKDLEELVVAFK